MRVRRQARIRGKKPARSKTGRGGSLSPLLYSVPRVLGEPHFDGVTYSESAIRRFARENRHRPTRSEIRLEILLRSLNGGKLVGRYCSQHPISGKWIVDFFFPEVRLAIEVDGPYHSSEEQRQRDREKEFDCQRFDITLLRLTNAEVWGNPDALVERLRKYWREASRRPNKIIGKSIEEYSDGDAD